VATGSAPGFHAWRHTATVSTTTTSAATPAAGRAGLLRKQHAALQSSNRSHLRGERCGRSHAPCRRRLDPDWRRSIRNRKALQLLPPTVRSWSHLLDAWGGMRRLGW
jgi:hypothetical protein